MLILRALGVMMDTTLKVVEAVDPDFDAATAGSSWNMLELKGERDICAVLDSRAADVVDCRERQSSWSPLVAAALCSRRANQAGHQHTLAHARTLGQKGSNLIGHGSCWLPAWHFQWSLLCYRHWRTHAGDKGGHGFGQSKSGVHIQWIEQPATCTELLRKRCRPCGLQFLCFAYLTTQPHHFRR